jgi:hypothetical protein
MNFFKRFFKISVRPTLAFFVFVSGFISEGYAQKVNGYYISNKGDTIFCRIKLPKNESLGLAEIKVIDSADNEISLTPADIKSFFYTHKKTDHLFFPKLTDDSSFLFIEALARGANTNLYCYDIAKSPFFTYGGAPGMSSYPSGGERMNYRMYLFEIKGRGRYFLASNSYPGAIRSRLKYFYGGNASVMELVRERFEKRAKIDEDIKSLVEAINQM